MSRAAAKDDIVIGGEPRVDLLPPEVIAQRRSRTLRRGLAAMVVLVVVIVGGCVTAATLVAFQRYNELEAERARTAELLVEQSKYLEVKTIQDEVDATVAARQLGATTEVDWKAYLTGLRAALPPDVGIVAVNIDSASPLAPYAQATAPLQAERIATLAVVLTTPNLPAVPAWLEAMKSLPGYADGTPGLITRADTGVYTVELTLHINDDAYSNRFADPVAAEGE